MTGPALPRRLPPHCRLYLRPLGLLPAARAEALLARGEARRLAGGSLAATHGELVIRAGGGVERVAAPLAEIAAWCEAVREASERVAGLLERMTVPRRLPAPGRQPLLMGVVNVTPDSFSDGGAHLEPAAAVAQALRLVEEGAAILDIGGESTRPGASPVSAEEERRRVAPVLERLAAERRLLGTVALAIDSRKAVIMRAALDAGATILNDVSALADDPESLPLAAASEASVVLMHRGEVAPEAGREALDSEAALDLFDVLEARIGACEQAGIGRERLIVDPGIGFGKSGADNLAILRQIGLLHGLGCPILLGVSRKGLTGALDQRYAPTERLPGSLAAALLAAGQGVQMLRVHDVAATWQALAVWRGLLDAAD